MAHPPGYSLLLAFLFSIFGESDGIIQTVSILIDSLSAVLVVLTAYKLFSKSVAILVGFLAAFCPQFAFNSVLFLPDTLAIFPLLLAIYFFIFAYKKPQLMWILACGFCLGLSCWLRANSLLMPIFFVIAISLLFDRRIKIYFSLALTLAFLLTVAPITLRNAYVYGAFIPISLGAGQTMLEGIGDYDLEKRFGIPNTDVGIMRQEAAIYDFPDYGVTLFGENGIGRDRMRVKRGLRFVGENPLWFGKVMFLRASSMTKLERVTVISPEIPVTNKLPPNGDSQISWKSSGAEIFESGTLGSDATFSRFGENVSLTTDDSKYGLQFSSSIIDIKQNVDYLVELKLRTLKGRVSIKTVGAETGKVYAFSTINLEEWDSTTDPPEKIVLIPFSAGSDHSIKIAVYNESPTPPGSVIEIKEVSMTELGESSFVWTKPIRFIVGNMQKLFKTAVMFPLALIGFILLIVKKKWGELGILMIIPTYYFCIQSILHTEYRYVMAIHYFFFVFAAFGVVWVFRVVSDTVKNRFWPAHSAKMRLQNVENEDDRLRKNKVKYRL